MSPVVASLCVRLRRYRHLDDEEEEEERRDRQRGERGGEAEGLRSPRA